MCHASFQNDVDWDGPWPGAVANDDLRYKLRNNIYNCLLLEDIMRLLKNLSLNLIVRGYRVTQSSKQSVKNLGQYISLFWKSILKSSSNDDNLS